MRTNTEHMSNRNIETVSIDHQGKDIENKKIKFKFWRKRSIGKRFCGQHQCGRQQRLLMAIISEFKTSSLPPFQHFSPFQIHTTTFHLFNIWKLVQDTIQQSIKFSSCSYFAEHQDVDALGQGKKIIKKIDSDVFSLKKIAEISQFWNDVVLNVLSLREILKKNGKLNLLLPKQILHLVQLKNLFFCTVLMVYFLASQDALEVMYVSQWVSGR